MRRHLVRPLVAAVLGVMVLAGPGLVKLGRIDDGIEVLQKAGNGRATIARIDPRQGP
jgi:hypothetical protein